MGSTVASYLLSHSFELRLLTGLASIAIGVTLIKAVAFISSSAQQLFAKSSNTRLSSGGLSPVGAR